MNKRILLMVTLFLMSQNQLFALDQISLWDTQLPKIQMLIKENKDASDIEAEKLFKFS
ncbi:MAG: hypothetical protein Q8L85_05480 [Alphaproteobacteria bacterium]|nr:hypothetical protein [Alphaproteobacteria bacterium]